MRVNDETMNDKEPPTATEDMLADLGVSGAQADQIRALLAEVAGLAHEVPEPSDDVRALLGGAMPLRSRRRAAIVAVVGALALGGVSAAAATNRLPDPVQEVAADATGGFVPHPIKPVKPVKPTSPAHDAPGHLDKSTATRPPKPDDNKPPGPLKTAAPAQIQKPTKPIPVAPEPAQPAVPGSQGGARYEEPVTGTDNVRAEPTDKAAPSVEPGTNHDAGPGSFSGKGKSR